MPNSPTEEVEVAVEQPLPTLELPEYHGRRPGGMKSSIGGSSNRITSRHEIGDTVVAVVELRMKKDGHEETDKDGLVYAVSYKMRDLFEVPGTAGKRLLSALRNAHRTGEDATNGRTPIDGFAEPDHFGLEGITDASGVAMTPTELAEARHDPVRALVDERLTPVVVVFSDGARELWPDEFDPETPVPHAGDRYEDDGAPPPGYVFVAKILDAETGETLEEWTEEQETARLEHLETVAEKAEREGRDALDAMRDAGYPGAGAPSSDDEEDLLEPYDGPGSNVVDLDAPLEDEPDDDPTLPTSADFTFVDCDVPVLKAALETVDTVDHGRRLLKAEQQGRGRGLKPRKGALDAIERRISELAE